MKTETIQSKEYTVEVSEATYLMGTVRAVMQEAQRALIQARNNGNPEGEEPRETTTAQELAEDAMRMTVYPALIAATIGHDGFPEWPPTFEAFIALPERFAAEWENTVYALNPHWKPVYLDEDTAEGKAEKKE